MTGMQRLTLAILVLFFGTGFDRVTKNIAQARLTSSPPISLLNDTIRIQYTENPGVILGLGSSLPAEVRFALFVLLNGLISALTLLFALKSRDLRPIQRVGLLLVASGGLGNLLDRLFNNGAAIDFMSIGIGSLRTGIFNVADVLIVAGAVIFMLFSVRNQRKATVA